MGVATQQVWLGGRLVGGCVRSQNRKSSLMVRALSNQEAPCWLVLILLLPPAGSSAALNVALRPVGGVEGRGGGA